VVPTVVNIYCHGSVLSIVYYSASVETNQMCWTHLYRRVAKCVIVACASWVYWVLCTRSQCRHHRWRLMCMFVDCGFRDSLYTYCTVL